MTRIYLVRHAEAEGNLYRIAQGQDNSNRTDDHSHEDGADNEKIFGNTDIDNYVYSYILRLYIGW